MQFRLSAMTSVFLRGALWNTGAFLAGQGLRFATNVVLARLLAPELFGTITIVNTIRTGSEMISDFGAGQNIVSSENADNPRFYNTVFTFQAIRGALIWLGLCVAAQPVASLYKIPDLIWIIPITGMGSFIFGFISPAREFLRKRLRFKELGVNEIIVSCLVSLAFIAAALISRSIWSLVFGTVASTVFVTVGSYFLRAGLHLRLQICREFASEILHYGKWIFLSTLAYFLATYYDRLFFAKYVPLGLFGVYGIARSIADLISVLAGRLGGNVLFPYIASAMGNARATLRKDLSSLRFRFVALCSFGLAVLVASSDLMIRLLYDRRYHDATWLLPVLVLGSWLSILATLNEAALLGLGKPTYGAISNVVKLVFLIVGLPVGFDLGGLLGATLVVAVADLPKLLVLLIGGKRERFSFARQDGATTLAMLALLIVLEALRWRAGFGTSFDTLPLAKFW